MPLPTVSSEPPGAAENIKRNKKTDHGHVETRKSWTLAELQTLSVDIREAAHQLNDFVTWANALVSKRKLFPEEDY
jgi:hypothetical protein